MANVRHDILQLGAFWVSFLEGNAGDLHVFRIREEHKRQHTAHREITVAGSKKIVRKPVNAPEWPIAKAGDKSDARPHLAVGTYAWEYLEDDSKDIQVCGSTERVTPFETGWIDVPPGGSFSIQKGISIGLFGSMKMDDGETREGLIRFLAESRAVKFTAVSRVLGVAIWAA